MRITSKVCRSFRLSANDFSEDPIGFADGANPYRYVGNNPVNFVDPTGLFQAGNPLASLGSGLGLNSYTPLNSYPTGALSGSVNQTPSTLGCVRSVKPIFSLLASGVKLMVFTQGDPSDVEATWRNEQTVRYAIAGRHPTNGLTTPVRFPEITKSLQAFFSASWYEI